MDGVPEIRTSDVTGEVGDTILLAPLNTVLVKGWTRSVVAVMVMMCCYKNNDFLKAGSCHCFIKKLAEIDIRFSGPVTCGQGAWG